MTKPLFIVPIADLDYGEQERRWEVPNEWLARALAGTDAAPGAEPGNLSATLSKSGREVMVRGRVEVLVTMPCARTLDAVSVNVAAEVFLLLSPAAEAGRGGAGRPAPGKRRGRGKKGPKWEQTPLLSGEDAARDTHDGQRVVLDDFVREFILLELPLTVYREDLRSEDSAAIEAPAGSGDFSSSPVDPRLAPLAAIADRLRRQKE